MFRTNQVDLNTLNLSRKSNTQCKKKTTRISQLSFLVTLMKIVIYNWNNFSNGILQDWTISFYTDTFKINYIFWYWYISEKNNVLVFASVVLSHNLLNHLNMHKDWYSENLFTVCVHINRQIFLCPPTCRGYNYIFLFYYFDLECMSKLWCISVLHTLPSKTSYITAILDVWSE